MSPMRSDPSGTGLAARALAREIILRFEDLAAAVSKLVGDEDCFGLEAAKIGMPTPISLAGFVVNPTATFNAEKAVWRFRTDAQKVDAFNKWLRNQVQHDVLETDHLGRPWLEKALTDTYGRGLGRGYVDAKGKSLRGGTPAFLAGSKHEFVSRALADPQTMARIQLVSSRAFEELRGLSATASTQLNRILTRGLIQKNTAKKLAKEMSEKVEGLSKDRALLISRTELVHAQAEAQLDAYEALGSDAVQLFAEWGTAQDDRVCAACGALEGTVFRVKDARGLLPRHPACRCCWLPANDAQGLKQQVGAIEDSLKAETGSKSKTNPGRKSSWAGKLLARKLKLKRKGPTSNAARAVGAKRLLLAKKAKPKGKMASMAPLKADAIGDQASWLTMNSYPAEAWLEKPNVTFNAPPPFDPAKHPHDALGHWASVPGHKLPANGAKDEIPVRSKYKGKETHGVLKGLEHVHVDGLNLGAPSKAAATVMGAGKTNGWTFWQYQSDDGKWHNVHEIRPVAPVKILVGADDQMKGLIDQGKTKDEILAHFTAAYDKIGQKNPEWIAKKVAQLQKGLPAPVPAGAKDAYEAEKAAVSVAMHEHPKAFLLDGKMHKILPDSSGWDAGGPEAGVLFKLEDQDGNHKWIHENVLAEKLAAAPAKTPADFYAANPEAAAAVKKKPKTTGPLAAIKPSAPSYDPALADELAPDDEPTAVSPGFAAFTPEAAKEFFAKKFGQSAPKVVKQVDDPLLPTALPHAPPKTAPPTMAEKQEMGVKLTAAVSKFPGKFKIASPAGEVVWAKVQPYTLGAPKSASHVDWATGIPQIVVKGYDDGNGLGTWQPGHLQAAIDAAKDLTPVEKTPSVGGGKQLSVDLLPIDHWVKSDRSRGSGNTMGTSEKVTHHDKLLKEQGVNKTASDLAAIKVFTGGSSGSINKEMNEGSKTGPHAHTIKDLKKAAAKARFKEPVEIYRGMSGVDVEDIATWIQNADAGLPIEMKSFQSHSTSKPWYEESKHASSNVQFIVRTRQGLTVHHDSAFPGELEVIMPPTKYRVHKYVLTAAKSGGAPGLVAWLDDVGG